MLEALGIEAGTFQDDESLTEKGKDSLNDIKTQVEDIIDSSRAELVKDKLTDKNKRKRIKERLRLVDYSNFDF